MKFTRYEIQAFTQTNNLDEDREPLYAWIPVPELRLADLAERARIARLRDEQGRFSDLCAADAVYRMLQAERPGAILRLRKVVIQEVYTTLDGSDSDDEERVRRESVVLEPVGPAAGPVRSVHEMRSRLLTDQLTRASRRELDVDSRP